MATAPPARVQERTSTRVGRRPRLSPGAKIAVRLTISVALLTVLVLRIPMDSMRPRNSHLGTLAFLVAGLGATALGFLLSSWRWQRVLRAFDVHVRLRTLVKHSLAGQFVGNVLPSTVGGDVLRVSRATTSTGSADVAFASIVIERLTGFVALPLLTVVGLALRPSLVSPAQAWIAPLIAVATIVALGAILFVTAHPQLAGRFASHGNAMRFVGAVHLGVDRLRREPRQAVGVLVAALAYQSSVVAAVWCAVHTLGIDVPNAAVLAFVPAVAMAQVLPLSLSGLGIREGLLVLLLHPLGVPTGKAIGLGLLWYGMTLTVSLLGAPAFAMGHHRQDGHRLEGRAHTPTDPGDAG